jgi:excisionase family DNA binding protein
MGFEKDTLNPGKRVGEEASMTSPRIGQGFRDLLSVGEAAGMLCIHPNTIRRWEAEGLIQAWRVGPRRDRRFRRSEVLHLLQGQPQPVP